MMDASTMTDEDLDEALERLSSEKKERDRKTKEREKRFFDALPPTLDDGFDFRFVKSGPGRFSLIPIGDEAELTWGMWWKFAHRIIDADRDAKVASRDTSREIASVHCFDNGMTMVFDQHGEQMPAFQGPTSEVMQHIRASGWSGQPEFDSWRMR